MNDGLSDPRKDNDEYNCEKPNYNYLIILKNNFTYRFIYAERYY